MPRPPRGAFYLLFTASGFAGLIYESIWTHYLKLFLGHAAYAQSLVLIAFMGGMALGAAWCARLSTRIANPLSAYAAVEAAVGLLALAFHDAFVLSTDWTHAVLLPLLGGEWAALAAKLAVSLALVLPQSVLLGATFPLMSSALARAHRSSSGESIAMLYFTNSLGAAAGVLASGFVLIAWVGLPGTLRIAGVLNLALAAIVWTMSRSAQPAPLAAQPGREGTAHALLAVAFLTGLASFVYEISWIRMLSLVLGASTHSFELMLSTFILGLALGGLAVRRQVDASASPERLLGWVQVVMAVLALLTLAQYNLTFDLMEGLMKGLARTPTGYALFNLSGQAISALIMLPATFCAGMTLPLITGALMRRGAGEAAIGQVYAANTLGAICGVVLSVHVGLPMLGLKGTLIFGCLVDAALGLWLLHRFAGKRLDFVAAAAACACLFVAIGAAVQLDARKMTAGVFRHGELASARDAQILFQKDGKTATVHLVAYGDAYSIRTNGKSDGSINMNEGERGTDEITMVLTGALPLALRPDTKNAAVIGIGTGLTTHTLLQSMAIESVETVEIESAMAEASRGFMPRNSSAFADPRGTILIEDAKTFFSARGRRYDLIISEPSNPWVSGVASLFTREFYQRIRGHLSEGGLLVQWFQLYEVDPALVATVMRALGEAFPHYAVFAPSDHDLLIVASESPIPLPAQARVFEEPGLAKELWTVHVLSAGDLDARYLGSRALLEPLFASYGMPANSDFYPVLDLQAARDRYLERSATDLVALLNAGLPALEMLDPARSRRPINPLFKGADSFARVDNARLAWYARDFLTRDNPPFPEAIPQQFQKDLEIVRTRLVECRQPRELDVWAHSLVRVARTLNPHLEARDVDNVWARIERGACIAQLTDYQQRWVALARAVGQRDAGAMADLASILLDSRNEPHSEAREYLLGAALTGAIVSGRREQARALWDKHLAGDARLAPTPLFRLLRCHVDPGDTAGCAAAFRVYAER